MNIIQHYMQLGGEVLARPWEHVRNMANGGYRWLNSQQQGRHVPQLPEVIGEIPHLDPQYEVQQNLVEQLHPAHYALEGARELLSARAIATLNAASAYQNNQQERHLLTSLQRNAQGFLNRLPGSAASQLRANELNANGGFFSWLRKTPSQREAVKTFVAEQEKAIEEIQKRENEITDPPVLLEQKVWTFLRQVPKKLNDLAQWIGYFVPLRPTTVQAKMMQSASDLINDLNRKIGVIDSTGLSDLQSLVRERGTNNMVLQGLFCLTLAPSLEYSEFCAQFPFYNNFNISHRGGNLLKGEGEFVILESDRPIYPLIPVAHLRNPALPSNIPVNKKYKELEPHFPVLQGIEYEASIEKIKEGNANTKVYRIPVRECANSIIDTASIGTRQRYEINRQNHLVFSSKAPQEEGWNESTERTAAIGRMQSILIMQELIKLTLYGQLDTLTFNEYKNAMAFLGSIESNDLARKQNGGYVQEPMHRDVSTLFNTLKPHMKQFMIERHVHQTSLKIIEDKGQYKWNTDKQRYTHLLGLQKAFPIIRGQLSTLQTQLETANVNGSLTWMIGEIRKITENVDRIIHAFALPEFTNAEGYFKHRNENANAEIPALLRPLIQEISWFYSSTSQLSILCRTSVYHDVFEECKRSIPKGWFGRLTKAHKQIDETKQALFKALQDLNAGLPKFELEMRDIVSGAPYDPNITQLIAQHASMQRAFDLKEEAREDFVANLLSKPYAEAMNIVVPKKEGS